VQIVPAVLSEMKAHLDRARARRAADATMKMVKLEIATLQVAWSGTSVRRRRRQCAAID
jgi:hypothetical protein